MEIETHAPNNWWNDFFESDVWAQLHLQSKREEKTAADIDFIKKVVPNKEKLNVLDMPCGVGRHAIALARLGHNVVGVDNSKNLLRLADQQARSASVTVDFQKGDMRTFKAPYSFDAALMMWGSLGYFSDSDTQQMFKNIAESLRPGGVLIFDQPVLDSFLKGGFAQNPWSEVMGLYVMERVNWNSAEGRNDGEWIFVQNGQTAVQKSSIRIYTHHELCTMLKNAGFKDIKSYGSLDLKPFQLGDRLHCVASV